MTERPKTEEFNKKDPALDLSLRPNKFRDFVGQARVKERLEHSSDWRIERVLLPPRSVGCALAVRQRRA